jgi:glycosyltransferase involved in cell wall biosynthesis
VKVAIDTTPLAQTRAGTARHVRGLLGELRGRPGLELVGVASEGTGTLATLRRDALWYPLRLGRAAVRVDLLHCTTFRAPASPRVPLVVTVHDLALLRHPEAFPAWHRLSGALALRLGVRAADAVVVVSAFTRDELVDLLRVPVERIRVVPNGVDPVFVREGPVAEGDYVLAVGTLEPRKNLSAAVEAARLADVELRVAGAAGWGGIATTGWVGEPTDAELAALMRGARCLVYPSLYEGFGLPILEAMACGVPVVTSRGGATEEIAGGAAVLVDPHDPASIAAGIEQAERRRGSLVEIGIARASMFGWRRSADLVEDLWRELA